MSSLSPKTTGQSWWRSLDHLAETDEFRAFMFREFPAGASELLADDRRQFLKIMGASFALAGLGMAGCRRWPDEKIAPYASRPVGRDPGTTARYATCREMNGVASGLLVTAWDGRPTKIEGNPEHPVSLGAADIFDQASVLDLYDPDRSRNPVHDGEASSWDAFETWAAAHFEDLRIERGNGLAVLCEASNGPSVAAMKERFIARFPMANWHTWEPVTNDHEIDGSLMAFGAPHATTFDLSGARIIVALDADLLGADRNAVHNIRGFAAGRRVSREHAEMSRMYAFEADMSLTGANADERVAMRRGAIPQAAAYLAGKVLHDAALEAAGANLSADAKRVLDAAASDLAAHRGAGAVACGAAAPAGVHYLVHLVNAALGNAGHTVKHAAQPQAVAYGKSLADLASAIGSGSVSTLVIIGGNPAWDAPANLGFSTLIGKVAHTIHLSDHVNETSAACSWHLNRAHFLETWGDGVAADGTYTLGQPLIEPLFGGRSTVELFALLTHDDVVAGHDIVRRTFARRALGKEAIGITDEKAWRKAIHDGFHGAPAPTAAPSVDRSRAASVASSVAGAAASGMEVAFVCSPTLWDGRFANNGWLQEAPDPISKLTWDNAALIAPAKAEELGVTDGDMLAITVSGKALDVPALRVAGIDANTVVLSLGGGRGMDGRICAGAGFNVNALRSQSGMWSAKAEVARGRGSYVLAATQDHHAIDAETVGGQGIQDRLPTIFREADLNEYREHPEFAKHRTHVVHRLDMWTEDHMDGNYAWAMSIDLNSCVGCSACVVACQAENNIPIVGKDQVKRGREMHWIRIDRYYKFAHGEAGPDTSRLQSVALQPVLCMHCENAPCEQVCPVAATTHDRDGLNVMVYNRCIGTRYCSNNCPYKVRRFNYFDYWRREPDRERGYAFTDADYYVKHSATPNELRQLQFNPDVTVRMRGIMEKCTYCIQRISSARIAAKNAFASATDAKKTTIEDNGRVPIPDGTITPACAQTCPAGAIVFGDRRDKSSRVAAQQSDGRSYQMLEELNVQARTRYLAKVRNPIGGGSAGSGGHGEPSGDGHGAEEAGHGADEGGHA